MKNINDIHLELETSHPAIEIEGGFRKADLTVLGQKIVDSGTFKLNLKTVAVKVSGIGKLLKHQDGSYYPEATKVTVHQPKIKGFHIDASNLMKDDPKLSAATLNMANSMWEPLYTQAYPVIEKLIEKDIKLLVNRFFKLQALQFKK